MPRLTLYAQILIITLYSFTVVLLDARCDEASGNMRSAIIVGANGTVVEMGINLKEVRRRVLDLGLGKACHVTNAALDSDDERLYLAAQLSNTPLAVIDLETLDLSGLEINGFPPLEYPYRTYLPVTIVSPKSGLVYVTDETFGIKTPSFGAVLVDTQSRYAKPLPGFPMAWQSSFYSSPEGRYMFVDGQDLALVETSTGTVRWRVKKTEYGYARTCSLKVNWDRGTVEIIWAAFREDKQPVFEQVNLDFKNRRKNIVPYTMPWIYAHGDGQSLLSRVLRAYSASAQGRQSGTLPVMDDPLRSAKNRLTEHVLAELPFDPHSVYISPGGTYLFAVQQLLRQDSPMAYVSEYAVLDLISGKVVRKDTLGEDIVTILFRKQ